MESLPVMLQFALFFSVGLIAFLWDINVSAAKVVLTVVCLGCTFYASIAVFATVWKNRPFQTPLSILLPKLWVRAKDVISFVQSQLKHGFRGPPPALKHLVKHPSTDTITVGMKLSDPALWRRDPLFVFPL